MRSTDNGPMIKQESAICASLSDCVHSSILTATQKCTNNTRYTSTLVQSQLLQLAFKTSLSTIHR